MRRLIRSFRDPGGCCCVSEGRVLRFVGLDEARLLGSFLATKVAQDFASEGRLVTTKKLSDQEVELLRQKPEFQNISDSFEQCQVFEHEPVNFPSYPYEWPAEMLWSAGLLTLNLAKRAFTQGYGLKDATPYNVLFRGPVPVFVDLLSFEKRVPGDVLWNPYAQFARTFLLPLLAHNRWGVQLVDTFTTRRDGFEPEELYRYCSPLGRLNPKLLSLITMPTWLGRKGGSGKEGIYKPHMVNNPDKARFIVESLFGRLERSLRSLEPRKQEKSTWSDYMDTHSYSDPAFASKEKFVSEVLAEFKPRRVLDAGANTGHFSALAARNGAEVVAIDLDPVCVGAMWRKAQAEKLNILPLVINLGRPSPGLGWRNSESASFLDRAAGAFDGVMMLALIHHLLVTERIPLDQVLDLAADLTREFVIIEFVAPQDDMFRQLTRGRDHLHSGLDAKVFENACRARFEIVKSQDIPGTLRRMYCLQKKSSQSAAQS